MTHAGMILLRLFEERFTRCATSGSEKSHEDLHYFRVLIGAITPYTFLICYATDLLSIHFRGEPDLSSITHCVFNGIEEFPIELFLHLLLRQPHEILPSKLISLEVGLASQDSALHKESLFDWQIR